MGDAVDASLDGATGVAVLSTGKLNADKPNGDKLRVLLVADVSAAFLHGGAERMLHHHIRALVAAGMKVTVLTRQSKKDDELVHKLSNGVVEHRLRFNGDKGWKGLLQLRKEAAAWWHTHKTFDVILGEQPFVMWAMLQAGCHLPRVQVCHSFAFEEYATRHGLDWNIKHRVIAGAMQRLEAKVYQSAVSCVVLSAFMQRRLMDFFELNQDRVLIAAGGIESFDLKWEKRAQLREEVWGEKAKAPVLVTLRNLVPRTGVDLLIQAAAIVHVDRPDVRWQVIGTGDLLEGLKILRDSLGMHDVVRFAGFLVEKKVQERLWTADAFVLPTRSLEGFGLVTLEANAHGLPVIATPVGANVDVVAWHALNHVADNVSPEALAKSVLAYLEAMPILQQREMLAEETPKYFAWETHDEILVSVIQSVLKP